jgi:hypothetical protein
VDNAKMVSHDVANAMEVWKGLFYL